MTSAWFEEYDDLVQDVAESNYQTFDSNVQRWLDLLDSHETIAAFVNSLESAASFDGWWAASHKNLSAVVGSGQLNFPREPKERLALQIGLFRAFGSGQIQVPGFALNFFYVPDGNFDAQTNNIAQRLFLPLARELRRNLQKLDFTDRPAEDDVLVPASDRTVALNHNSAELRDAIAKIQELIETIEGINDFAELPDRDQRVAELRATKEILHAPKMRESVWVSLVQRCLRYLAVKFADGIIGVLAETILKLLAGLVGLQL